ncbi:MAG: peptidylprolyl isomerase [Pseudomonadales bacterium]|nr:peptidylprolyl isomerase [Pseudomonadales bacterium]
MQPIIFLLPIWLILTMTSTSSNADNPLTTQSVLEASSASDWRTPKPENLLYLILESNQVVFEIAPEFAPAHIANIRELVADRYFDNLSIIRSQDNYVVQWGDPAAGSDKAKSLGNAKVELEPEFFRKREGLDIVPLSSRDAYAEEVGFVDGFPVASDTERSWLTHCYGMLGVGRDYAATSGNGAELYAVTGHAPRHLDRNVTLIGRVLKGIEHLSSLPRGTGELGFYEDEKEYVKIKAIRFGHEIPEQDRLAIEVMRTDTDTFAKYVQSRTFRLHEWFVDPAGKIELCNVSVPARDKD